MCLRSDIQTTREKQLCALLDFGRGLTPDLDLDAVLARVVETARSLTGARHAAVAVRDDRQLEGSPVGRPPPRDVLGAPIEIRGEVWGDLRVAEKEGGEDFDEDDAWAIAGLADWAAVAIQNAQARRDHVERTTALERAMRGTRASADVALALGDEPDLGRIVELIAQRGQALVEADALLVLLADGADLRIAAYAGNASLDPATGVPIAGSVSGRALLTQRPQRVNDMRVELVVRPDRAEMPGARSALVVPLVFRGVALGVLSAFDHLGGRPAFDVDDERALRAFAVGAATAVSAARAVEAGRLRGSIAATEAERKRWARELHDETLQGLGAIKLALTAAVRAGPHGGLAGVEDAIALLDGEIAGLRSTIADLRPAALDRLGLEPALRSLGARAADRGGLGVEMSFDLGDARLTLGVESAVYRIAQEALTNVVRHAQARTASLTLTSDGDTVRLRVTDDGRGVVGEPTGGFGLLGMRERAALAGGAVLVEAAGPEGSGTRVQLTLPIPAPVR